MKLIAVILLETFPFPSGSAFSFFFLHVCLWSFLAQTEGHQADLLAGRVVVWSPWEPGLITQADTLMDVWWTEQVQQPPAVEKLIFRHSQTLPSCLARYGCCGVLMHACELCLYPPASPPARASSPICKGEACRRMGQLQKRGPGRNVTSFADLPLTGQLLLFRGGFVHSHLEKCTGCS